MPKYNLLTRLLTILLKINYTLKIRCRVQPLGMLAGHLPIHCHTSAIFVMLVDLVNTLADGCWYTCLYWWPTCLLSLQTQVNCYKYSIT